MSYKFNPLGPPFDLVRAGANTSLATNIPEYTSDPVSPIPQDAWVLRQGSVASVTGGGTLYGILGLSTYLVTSGSGGASSYTYQLSYRTLENTTKRVSLS